MAQSFWYIISPIILSAHINVPNGIELKHIWLDFLNLKDSSRTLGWSKVIGWIKKFSIFRGHAGKENRWWTMTGAETHSLRLHWSIETKEISAGCRGIITAKLLNWKAWGLWLNWNVWAYHQLVCFLTNKRTNKWPFIFFKTLKTEVIVKHKCLSFVINTRNVDALTYDFKPIRERRSL